MRRFNTLLMIILAAALPLTAAAKSQTLAKWQKQHPGLELFHSAASPACAGNYPNSISVVRQPDPDNKEQWLYGLTITSGDIPRWGKHRFLLPLADQEIHLSTPGCLVMIKATGDAVFSLYQVESPKRINKIRDTVYTAVQPYHVVTAAVFVAAYEEDEQRGFRVDLINSMTGETLLNIPFVKPYSANRFVYSLPELRDDWQLYQRSWLWYLEVQHTGGTHNIIATELNASATTRFITQVHLTGDQNVPFVQRLQEHRNSGDLLRLVFRPMQDDQGDYYQPALSRGFSGKEEAVAVPGNGRVTGFRLVSHQFPGGYLAYENSRDFLLQRGVEQKHLTLVQVKHPDGQLLWHTLGVASIEAQGWREFYALNSLEYAGQRADGIWHIWGGPFPDDERDTGESLEAIFAKRHADELRRAADSEKRRQEQAAYEERIARIQAMQAEQRAQENAVIQRHIQQQQREMAARRELSNAINSITSAMVESASQVTPVAKDDCVNQGVRDSRFDNTGAGYNSYTKALERCIERKLRENR